MACLVAQVVGGVVEERLDFFVGERSQDAAGRTHDQAARRDDCPRRDDRSGGDERPAADDCAVEDNGADADERAVANGAAVQVGAVANGDARADDERVGVVGDVEAGLSAPPESAATVGSVEP